MKQMEYAVAKLLGAISGSSVALVFAKEGSTHFQLLKQFMVGVICGFSFAPFLIGYLDVPRTFDYWVFSATVCSVLSYYVLHIILAENILETLIKVWGGKK